MNEVMWDDWKDHFKQFNIGPINFDSFPSVAVELFKGTALPEIGGGSRVYNLLRNADLFQSLPLGLQETILDILYMLLRTGIYDVARFRCFRERLEDGKNGFVKILLNLLNKTMECENLLISKSITRLLGIVCAAGITTEDLKEIIHLLRKPTALTTSLLQALKTMIRQDDGVVKASPTSFFNFNGFKSGLFISSNTFPFVREYQLSLWFRVENFKVKCPVLIPHTHRKQYQLQHLFTCLNANFHGIDIYLEDKNINLDISDSKNDHFHIKITKCSLRRGVWYHLCVKHSKPRISIFTRDELCVYVDHELVHQSYVKFPNSNHIGEITDFSFGKNFDGQLGPINIFAESLPQNAIEVIARLNAGKGTDGQLSSSNAGIDLLPTIASSDRKVLPFSPKLLAAYHPSRCVQRTILDIHGGRHARLGRGTYPWNIVNARDVFTSLGGISCLLPLFSRLLIDDDYFATVPIQPPRPSPIYWEGKEGEVGGLGVGFGFSANVTDERLESPRYRINSLVRGRSNSYKDNNNSNTTRDPRQSISFLSCASKSNSSVGYSNGSNAEYIRDSPLSYNSLRLLWSDTSEISEEGIVSLLLSLIARCIRSHRTNQKELLRISGVEMIEFALISTPSEVLRREGESCVLALIQLQSASKDFVQLESSITKNLICNFKIWSRSSFQLQNSLMSVILAAVKAQPEYFISAIGVRFILDCIATFYVDNLVLPTQTMDFTRIISEVPETPLAETDVNISESLSSESLAKEGVEEKGVISNDVGDTWGVGSKEEKLHAETVEGNVSKELFLSASPSLTSASPPRLFRSGSAEVSISPDGSNESANFLPSPVYAHPTVRRLLRDSDGYVTSGSGSPPHTPMRRMSFMDKINRQASIKNMVVPDEDEDEDEKDDLRTEDKVIPPHSEEVHVLGNANSTAGKRLSGASLNTGLEVVGSDDDPHSSQASDASETPDVGNDVQPNPAAGRDPPALRRSTSGSSGLRGSLRTKLEPIYEDLGMVSSNSTSFLQADDSPSPLNLPLDPTSDFDAIDLPSILSEEEKLHIRRRLQTILLEMIRFGLNANDILAIVDFLALVPDVNVLNETAQVLLSILFEFGTKVAILIAESCHGPEEFAAFVLCYLVNRDNEELRCTGIRLLIHFYLHTESFSAYLLNMTLKRRKGGVLARVRDRLSTLAVKGIERLGVFGGLGLLSRFLLEHRQSNFEQTYSVLIEMLLATRDLLDEMCSQHSGLFDENSPMGLQPPSTHGGNAFPTGLFMTSIIPALVNAKNITDETAGISNPIVLSVFFDILPTFPGEVLKRVYGDLLAMLKHSPDNRNAFLTQSKWHICFTELVSQNIIVQENRNIFIRPVDISSILERHLSTIRATQILPLSSSGSSSSNKDIPSMFTPSRSTGILLRDWDHGQTTTICSALSSPRFEHDVRSRSQSTQEEDVHSRRMTDRHGSSGDPSQSQSLDVWFDIGMKIYATMLLHALDLKGGWRELEKAFIQWRRNQQGAGISHAVVSHVLHELTFTMKSKYKDLQRQARSTNTEEMMEATSKLENMLVLLIACSLFILEDVGPVVTYGLEDMNLGRKRYEILEEIHREELELGHSLCVSRCTNETHHVCEEGHDLCFVCGHSASLHDPDPTIMDLVEKRLKILLNSTIDQTEITDGDNSPKSIFAMKLSDHSTLLNSDPLQFHNWVELTPGSLVMIETFMLVTASDGNGTPLTHMTGLSDLPQPPGSRRSSMSGGSTRKLFSTIDNINPLQRCVDLTKSRVILTLQVLRFFDIIFWPLEGTEFRNVHLLRFQREHAVQGLDNPNITRNIRSPSSLTMASSYPMSLLHSSMRLSLFALLSVPPTEDVAELNIRRLHRFVKVLEHGGKNTSLVKEWLLMITVHVQTAIKRLKKTLQPLLMLMEVIPIVDHLGPSNDNGHRKFSVGSEASELTVDSGMDSSGSEKSNPSGKESISFETRLEFLFDNLFGKRLLKYIQSGLELLADLYKCSRELDVNSLEGPQTDSLSSFVDRYQSHSTPSSPEGRANHVNVSSTSLPAAPSLSSHKGLSMPQLGILMGQHSGAFGVSIPSIDGGGTANSNKDLLKDLAQSDDDGSIFHTHTLSDPTIPVTLLPQDSQSKIPLRRDRLDSNLSDDMVKEIELHGTLPASMPGTPSNPGLETPQTKPLASESESVGTGDVPVGSAKHVIHTLQWLLDPFFTFDAMANEDIIMAFVELEKFESEAMSDFLQAIKHLSDVGEENRQDTDSKMANEVNELQELGKSVHKMISQREERRYDLKKSEEASKNTVVATSWQTCLHLFDSDWSPWIHNEEEHRLKSKYYLSRHQDCRMQRMLLERMFEPTDHTNAAHMKGKGREDVTASTETSSSPFDDLAVSTAKILLKLIPKKDVTALEEDKDPVALDEKSSVSETVLEKGAIGLFSTAMKRPQWTMTFTWQTDEKEVVRMNANQIEVEMEVSGVLLMTNRCLYYHPKKWAGGLSGKGSPLKDKRWRLDRLVEAYGRRYLLQNSAIELFFADKYEVFFAFNSSAELNRFTQLLMKLKQNTPLLITPHSLNPRYLFMNSDWTELWRRRLISNFEYIMRLNIIAGRSYNDITQYPVFPWVLADYTSKDLDLNDPKSFRDLTKPIGALNNDRLAELMERYRTFEDPEVPKFMYGSHYSSAGVVLHYLLRMEPFTTLAVNLQGGKFDVPDRLFFDVRSTWEGCNNSISDVKELIPELFCCPEVLLNLSKLPLGDLQDNHGTVDDVILPAWAENAFEFVRLNREALESEYVSANLHHWIDLIFGYKQTGKAAIEANNVFYYLTYEGAVDLEAIEDELQREAAKQQVLHFGQTPSQLTTKEHPRRLPREECLSALCSDVTELSKLKVFTPLRQLISGQSVNMSAVPSNGSVSAGEFGPVTSIRCSIDRLIVYHADQTICHYRWSPFPDGDFPFQLRLERFKQLPSPHLSKSKENMIRRGFSVSFDEQPDVSNPSRVRSFRSNSISFREKIGTTMIRMKSFKHPIPGLPIDTLNASGGLMSGLQESGELSPVSNNTPRNDEGGGLVSGFLSKLNPFKRKTSLSNAKPMDSSPTDLVEMPGLVNPRSNSNVSDDQNNQILHSNSQSDWKYYNDSDEEGEEDSESVSESQQGGHLQSKSLHSVSEDSLDLNQSNYLDEDEGDRTNNNLNTNPCLVPNEGIQMEEDDVIMPLSFQKTANSNFETTSVGDVSDPLVVGTGCVALSLGEMGQGRVITCAYWDNSVKVHALDSFKEIASITGGHLGPITCLQLGTDGHTLITGGFDGTCRVWVLEDMSIASALSEDAALQLEEESDPNLICIHILCGHNTPVTAISYSHDHDLLLSGSKSGLLCLHTVTKGNCVRTISELVGLSADVLLLSPPGYLVVHSWTDLSLHLFWLNGQHMKSVTVPSRMECMVMNGAGNILLCGNADGSISLRTIHDICEHHVLDVRSHGAVRSLRFTEDNQFLMIGSEDGTFSLSTDPDVRWRMLRQAMQKMPLLGPNV